MTMQVITSGQSTSELVVQQWLDRWGTNYIIKTDIILYNHHNHHHHEADCQTHRRHIHIHIIFDHMLSQKIRHYTSLKLFWDNIIFLDPNTHKTYHQYITLIQHNLKSLLQNKTDHGTFWPIMSPGPVTVPFIPFIQQLSLASSFASFTFSACFFTISWSWCRWMV